MQCMHINLYTVTPISDGENKASVGLNTSAGSTQSNTELFISVRFFACNGDELGDVKARKRDNKSMFACSFAVSTDRSSHSTM